MKKCPFAAKALSATLAATILLSPAVSVYAAVPSTQAYNELPFVRAENGDLYLNNSFQNQSNLWLDDAEISNFSDSTAEEEPSTSTDSEPASSSSSSDNSSSASSESASSGNSASSESASSSSSSSSTTSDSSLDLLDDEEIDIESMSQATGVKGFIARLYKLVLGRPGDVGEIDFWANQLTSGAHDAAGVVHYFFNSPEFESKNVTDSEYVQTLYLTMLDRSYDQVGYDDWMQTLDSGVSRDYVLLSFLLSPEFSTICTSFSVTRGDFSLSESRDQNLAVTRFVSSFYKNCLGRNGDSGGLNTWTRELLYNSASGGIIAQCFFNSTEYLSKNASDAEFLETAYRAMLGRGIDSTGFTHWSNFLAQGYSRNYILASLAGSVEFANFCSKTGIAVGTVSLEPREQNPTITKFVQRSFSTILNRTPDVNSLNYYTSQLLNGQTASQYFTQLISSQEFKNRNLNNSQIVETLYQAMLNRSADPSGLTENMNFLNRYASPLYVARFMNASAEFSNICNSIGLKTSDIVLTEKRDQNLDVTDVAANTYRALLGREPDIGGLNELCANLTGKSSNNVLNALFNITISQEFKLRNLGSRDYVTAIFTALCGRVPTEAEISVWQNLLSPDNDGNRQIVFFLLGNSPTCSAYLGPKLGISTFTTQEKGIDVSAHQGVINWAEVASQGYTFAFIRAVSSNNISSSPVVDQYFYQNVRNAKAAGLKVGVYIYSYAKTSDYMVQEVNTCLNAIRSLEKEGYRFDYPVVLDMEEFKTSGPNWTQLASTGLVLIDQQGYYPCLYSYANAFKNNILNMNAPELKGYDLWVAHYGVSAMSYPGAIWQYTSSGSVRGINGNVDLNISYRDFASIIRAAGKNNLR